MFNSENLFWFSYFGLNPFSVLKILEFIFRNTVTFVLNNMDERIADKNMQIYYS